MKNYTLAHLIMIPMTGVGLRGGYRSDEWFRERVEIFKKYTLKSLQNQTSQKFYIWMTFRKEEYYNPILRELADFLKKEKTQFVFTFSGLMYHDDKFSKDIKTRLLNIARMIRDVIRGKANFNLREIFENKNDTLKERLEDALFQLNRVEPAHFSEADFIYLTRIDSDDMFHKDVAEMIEGQPAFNGALVFQKGFVYEKNTNRLSDWEPITNPPFHTIIFPSGVFFNASAHMYYMKDYKSHEDVTKIFNYRILPDYKYCVLVHGKNQISTVYNHPFKGEEITTGKEAILKNFGVDF